MTIDATDPPALVRPEPPEDPPFCDRCMMYGHEVHNCIDDYACPGSYLRGSFNALGTLVCPHCGAQFIGTTVPLHEEEA